MHRVLWVKLKSCVIVSYINKMCMAWFDLPNDDGQSRTLERFKCLVAKHDSHFEGWGIGADGRAEAYAVFDTKKKMESFARGASKIGCDLVGSCN